MTDTIQRDIAEIERQRDAFARLNRIAMVEQTVAVLEHRFEAAIQSILKELERAVSGEDLRELRRELEDKMKEAITGIRAEIERSNENWAEKILAGSRVINAELQNQRHDEQRRFRQQIVLAIIGATLSIIGALFVFWLTTGRP
jgi:hypothetical protein